MKEKVEKALARIRPCLLEKRAMEKWLRTEERRV